MADDKLEKRSKNVREQTRGLSYENAQARILRYIRRVGFRAEPGTQDRFGVGKDQHGLRWNPMTGGPEHELAHALMTPEGETLRGHQRKLGQVYTPQDKRGMSQEEGRKEEAEAFEMEPAIGRRAGVQVKRGHGHPSPIPHAMAGRRELEAFEEGRKVVDPRGRVVPGTSIDAKINARGNLARKREDASLAEDLRKGPPPIPGLKPPTAEQRAGAPMPSPWDDQEILSSAPAPTPTPRAAAGLKAPSWLGRPIAHPDHAEELEQNAAVNEFGLKMPRKAAEDSAYGDYVKGQHVAASAHHLAGMKAANAAGDKEAARKHGLMYDLHSKALGHEPVGPAHPAVAAALAREPAKVYKFKPHRGDLFALQQPKSDEIQTSAPPLGKAEHEALGTIYQACQALQKGDVVQGPWTQPQSKELPAGRKRWTADEVAKKRGVPKAQENPKGSRHVGNAGGFDKYDYSDHLDPAWQERGMKIFVFHEPESGRVSASLANSRGALLGTHERLGPENYRESGSRLPDHVVDSLYNAIDAHLGENGSDPKLGKGEIVGKIDAPPNRVGKRARPCLGCGRTIPAGEKHFSLPGMPRHCKDCVSKKRGEPTEKAEMKPGAGGPCRCAAYKFPHRSRGGKCRGE